MVFDGKFWITSALGDAYPQGITLSAIDSTEPINYRIFWENCWTI